MEENKNEDNSLLSKLMSYHLDIGEISMLLAIINSDKFNIYREILGSCFEISIDDPVKTGKFVNKEYYFESTDYSSIISLDCVTWLDMEIRTSLSGLWYCLDYITCGTFSEFFFKKSFKKIQFPYKVNTCGRKQ